MTLRRRGARGECAARTQGASISMDMDATEDDAACRTVRPGGTRLHFDSSSKDRAGARAALAVSRGGRAPRSSRRARRRQRPRGRQRAATDACPGDSARFASVPYVGCSCGGLRCREGDGGAYGDSVAQAPQTPDLLHGEPTRPGCGASYAMGDSPREHANGARTTTPPVTPVALPPRTGHFEAAAGGSRLRRSWSRVRDSMSRPNFTRPRPPALGGPAMILLSRR